ncbi:MAG: bifunctional acetate--CoA ligase family protein/GNAT family N-acetyltransferase [Methylophilus sp.]|nr:bifunctional acetate--CoA ligase family protein/GNAT family N-acetyltransferase [Methylophilus sp.]
MRPHYLTPLFSPKSVAIFGASNDAHAVGGIVFKNMLESGYHGALYPINPKHHEVLGYKAFNAISDIGNEVELAIITTPAATVPQIIEECGKHNVKVAVIISAGFGEAGAEGMALQRSVLENARLHHIRLVGPNCLGVMRPDIGLNATFNNGGANTGDLAFISQSGALCTAILDWAKSNNVGFSSVVSMGSSIDIDFGEILDYLVTDPKTKSILLYIEGIRNVRSFMSAIRAAAQIKPVILVKVGRHEVASKAAMSHTASLVGSDDSFDAAVRRVGVVRVHSVTQLFSVAKALSCGFHPTGNRLAVVTNGGGPGILATDYAADLGLSMAMLSDNTIEKLNEALPNTWSHSNPVDIIGDAQADRYHHAVTACMEDTNVDGVLTILTPQAMTRPLEVSQTILAISQQHKKPLLSCWMGGKQVEEARALFESHHQPNFRTPEPAVEVFAFLSAYYRNQKLLMQVPESISHHLEPDVESARMIIEGALQDKRKILDEMESKALLSCFHIPVARTMIARTANEALLIAVELGFPIAMKIHSPDITHKTDAGGVMLNIDSAQVVRNAYHQIIDNVKRYRPNVKIDGVAIEAMVVKPNGRELMIGVTSDPVFGPVITFGAGGTMVEVMGDRSVTLPPLNTFLVKDLIQSTHIAKMLGQFRHMPAINMEALESVLLRVSEMVCELPMLAEMDINPLIVDENCALAADARVVVAYKAPTADRYAHMAICPYPTYMVSNWQLADGTNITIRPIRPEDAKLVQDFVKNLSEESRYFRFMNSIQELSHEMLVRFTQIDYSREAALIAVTGDQFDQEVELGVARYSTNPDGESCEFALVIADSMSGKGLANKLMTALMEVAREKGFKSIQGEVLSNNSHMLKLMKHLNFDIETSPDDQHVKNVCKLL